MPKRLVQRNRLLLRVAVVTWVAILTAGTVSATLSSSSSSSSSSTDRQIHPPSLTTTTTKANQKIISMVESRLLNMFGLKFKPKPSPNVRVPDYMLQLFKKQQKLNKDNVMLASTIRSFSHQDSLKLSEQQDAADQFHFMFNVTRTPSEVLQAAELRLYRDSLHAAQITNRDRTRRTDSLNKSSKSRKNVQRILVYDVLHPSTDSSEAILRLIDSRQVDGGNEAGWESFDVFPAVVRWDKDPKSNHGLHVRVIPSDSPTANTGAVEPHVRLRRSASVDERTWHKQKPLLVTYSDDPSSTSRTAGNAERRRRSKERKGERRTKSKEHRVESCRRHSLYVDFADVGWNDWIVAPPGYQAYYCDGECKFPLPDHLNTTNHAIVQTLVHSVNPSSVPRVCCVPTELSPISMLYLDEYDKVVLKNYQDMVVEGCGCR